MLSTETPRCSWFRCAAVSLFVLSQSPNANGEGNRPESHQNQNVAQSVKDLGSEISTTRQRAEAFLSTLDSVPKELAVATSDKDPHVRLLARRVVSTIQKSRGQPNYDDMKKFGEHGRVDSLVEAVSIWPGSIDDERLWGPLLQIVSTVHEYEIKNSNRVPIRPGSIIEGDLPAVQERARFRGVRISSGDSVTVRNSRESHIHLAKKAMCTGAMDDALIVARNRIDLQKGLEAESLVLISNGTIAGNATIGRSIILCDGDLRIDGLLYHSIVICRGAVTCTTVESCMIVGKSISAKSVKNCYLSLEVEPNKETVLDKRTVVINAKVGDRRPLAFLDLSDILRCRLTADGAWEITSTNSRRAQALKVGDRFRVVGDCKPKTPAELRLAIRTALVENNCYFGVVELGTIAKKRITSKDALTWDADIPK